MAYNNLIIEYEEDLAVIEISRPRALNALNREVLTELREVFQQLADNREVRVIIITGAGEKAFIAGADITEMKEMEPKEAEEFAWLGHKTFGLIEKSGKPVIAAINGYALGGGNELALACDIRIASKNAHFGQPEVGLGIIPGFGGTQRLARIIGEGRAKELLFTGEIIDAVQAEKMGLVNKVIPGDQLLEEARALAGKIGEKAPLAVKAVKEAVNFGMTEGIEKGLAFESKSFALTFSTVDQKHGMESFLQKKQPDFKGK